MRVVRQHDGHDFPGQQWLCASGQFDIHRVDDKRAKSKLNCEHWTRSPALLPRWIDGSGKSVLPEIGLELVFGDVYACFNEWRR